MGDGTKNSGVVYSVLPLNPGETVSDFRTFGGTVFSFDNQLTLGSNPFLDDYGLVIVSNNGLYDVNIWGNYASDYTWFQNNWEVVANSTANLSGVPEPPTLFLLGAGLAGAVAFGKRFKKV